MGRGHHKVTLESVFEVIDKQGNIVYLLEEIRALIDSIPYDRLSILASALMGSQERFQGETTRVFSTLSASDITEDCVQEIIRKLQTEDERYSIIHDFAEHIDKNGIGALARLVYTVESGYGRFAGRAEKEADQLISLYHLQDLEMIFVSKVKSVVATESILELNDFARIIFLWEFFDKEGEKEYITNLFMDESQKLRFICAMATRWYGTNGSGWGFHSSKYHEYLSDEEIYELIQKYDKNKMKEFSDIEQVKLASFILNYQNDEMDYVNEQEAKNLLKNGNMIHAKN